MRLKGSSYAVAMLTFSLLIAKQSDEDEVTIHDIMQSESSVDAFSNILPYYFTFCFYRNNYIVEYNGFYSKPPYITFIAITQTLWTYSFGVAHTNNEDKKSLYYAVGNGLKTACNHFVYSLLLFTFKFIPDDIDIIEAFLQSNSDIIRDWSFIEGVLYDFESLVFVVNSLDGLGSILGINLDICGSILDEVSNTIQYYNSYNNDEL